MKSLFLLALLCILSHAASSQSIHFCDTSNKWRVFEYDFGADVPCCMLFYSFGHSFNIGGIEYESLNGVMVREDTLLKSVFIHSGSTDYLLYDFSLNLGDTLKTRYAAHIVSAIDSVQLDGQWYKIWSLHGYWMDTSAHIGMMLGDYSVLEGVGCLAAPFTPNYPFSFERGDYLTCFQNNGTHPVLSRSLNAYFDNAVTCEKTFGVGVPDISVNSGEVKVVPNPAANNSKIVFPIQINSGVLSIINTTGNLIGNIPVHESAEVAIGTHLPRPGVYFYRLIDLNTGQVISGQFLKD